MNNTTIKTIVVDIDDPTADDQPALRAAKAVVADQSGPVRVHLFHNVFHRNIIDEHASGDQVLDEARELLLAARQERLEGLAHEHFGGIADAALVWSDRGWQELIRFAVRHSSDLVIAPTQSQSHWQRLGRRVRLGNQDWELIRHCPMPLLLARVDSSKQYRSIVAAVDPLHADDKPAALDSLILKHAASFASQPEASLSIINVVTPTLAIPPSAMEPVAASAGVPSAAIDAHRAKLDSMMNEIDCAVDDCQVVAGLTDEEIVEYARQRDSDLVVMGAVSRARLERLLIGNTAERLLDDLECDVLIIKPPGIDRRLPAIAALMGTH